MCAVTSRHHYPVLSVICPADICKDATLLTQYQVGSLAPVIISSSNISSLWECWGAGWNIKGLYTDFNHHGVVKRQILRFNIVDARYQVVEVCGDIVILDMCEVSVCRPGHDHCAHMVFTWSPARKLDNCQDNNPYHEYQYLLTTKHTLRDGNYTLFYIHWPQCSPLIRN